MSFGEIKFFPYKFAPHGWIPCFGQTIPIPKNQGLFSILPPPFHGHQTDSFKLPDLQARTVLDAGNGYPDGSIGGSQTLPITGEEESNLQPYFSLNYIISLETSNNDIADPLLGEIRLFACPPEKAPEGWVPCDGRLLPISQYPALYSLLGSTFGNDGNTAFALPDLRGRLPIGTNKDQRNLQQTGGQEMVSLGKSGSVSNLQPYIALQPALQIADHTAVRTTSFFGGYLGEVQFFPGDHIPFEWAKCDGQYLSKTDYPELFEAIGTTYGQKGDISFQLPDATGRVVIGTGQGDGLTERNLGEIGGQTAVNTTSGATINNMQPFIAMTYMINIAGGAYPTRK